MSLNIFLKTFFQVCTLCNEKDAALFNPQTWKSNLLREAVSVFRRVLGRSTKLRVTEEPPRKTENPSEQPDTEGCVLRCPGRPHTPASQRGAAPPHTDRYTPPKTQTRDIRHHQPSSFILLSDSMQNVYEPTLQHSKYDGFASKSRAFTDSVWTRSQNESKKNAINRHLQRGAKGLRGNCFPHLPHS